MATNSVVLKTNGVNGNTFNVTLPANYVPGSLKFNVEPQIAYVDGPLHSFPLDGDGAQPTGYYTAVGSWNFGLSIYVPAKPTGYSVWDRTQVIGQQEVWGQSGAASGSMSSNFPVVGSRSINWGPDSASIYGGIQGESMISSSNAAYGPGEQVDGSLNVAISAYSVSIPGPNGKVGVKMYLDTSAKFVSVVNNASVACNGVTFPNGQTTASSFGAGTYSCTLTNGNTDYVTVRAIYETAAAPTKPTWVTQPAGGAELMVSRTQALAWTSSTPGTPGNSITYTLAYSNDGGSTWTNIATGLTTTSYTWTVPDDVGATNVLRVTAVESNGQLNASANSNTFAIVAEPAPAAPEWNTANNQTFSTNTPQLSFDAEPGASFDTVGDAEIDISTSSTFASDVTTYKYSTVAAGWVGVPTAVGGGEISYTPALSYGATYYARARIKNSGNDSWSDYSTTLTLSTVSPAVNTWQSPANNAGSTMNNKFKSWLTSVCSAAATITDAELQIASDSGFSSIVQDKQYSVLATGWQLPTEAGGGTVSYTIQTALNPGTYYMRLKTKDSNAVWSDWTSTRQVLVVAATFTNTITANQSKWKVGDVAELRTDINNARLFRGLASYSFTDTLTANATLAKPIHVNGLRTALAAVLALVGVSPTWSDVNPLTANGVLRRGQHLLDIRSYLTQT